MPTNQTRLSMFTRYNTSLFFFLFLAATIFPAPSPAASAEPIKIAGIFALTGKAKGSNNAAVLGTELAVREINLTGGVLGQPLELLLLDNSSSPIGSHLAAETAVRAKVTGIVGAVWSSHSLAIAKVAEKNQIPMISPISTIPSLTSIGDHIFRVCYDDNFQGKAIAEFAFKELKARTALVFVDLTSDFSLTLTDIFIRTFQGLGGRIVKEIEYKAREDDYIDQINEASGHDADIVLLSGHDESGAIAEKLQEAGMKAIPVGSDGWDVDSFFTLGGNKIRQGYFINHWTPSHANPLSRIFMKKYQNEGEIKASTALAYDAVNVLVTAIKRAGSTDSKAIRQNLHGLKGFKGITGDITFDAMGNATKKACVMEIRQGIPSFLKSHVSD